MRRKNAGKATAARGWVLAGSLLGLLAPLAAHGLPVSSTYFESFPDTLQIGASCGAFENLSVNGDLLSATGCLFQIENTSFGDGEASAFERDPSRHFARTGPLTDRSREVLSENQPYGLYSLELELPPGSGSLVSAPFGFGIDIEAGRGEVEIEFEISLRNHAIGLLFDSAAEAIPTVFQEPRTGVLDFFVSTRSGDPLANATGEEDGSWGIEFEAEFAWEDGGEVVTRSRWFRGHQIEVEGLAFPTRAVPEPEALTLWLLGLVLAARRETRSPSRSRSTYGSRPASDACRRSESPGSRLDPT